MSAAGDRFWPTVGMDVLSWIFMTLPFGVVVYLSIVGIAHAIRYFVEASEREVQMARLSEQLAGARLAALQAQLNPALPVQQPQHDRGARARRRPRRRRRG